MVNIFSLQPRWPAASAESTADELAATFCSLKMDVGGQLVTRYRTEDGIEDDHLELPGYFLAEWIAENWWALLWEPRKNEDVDLDPDFLSRHSFVAAQHGFPLPTVIVVPSGQSIEINCSPRQVPHAGIRFTNGGRATIKRQQAEGELRKYVDAVVDHLSNFEDLPLLEAWRLVRDTNPEEIEFCRLIGALGLSPYDTHGKIEEELDRLHSKLSKREVMDLCLTCGPDDFKIAAQLAEMAHDAMNELPPLDLAPLTGLPTPSDKLELPAWRSGVQAAKKLRSHLSINDVDIYGGAAVLDKLAIDPDSRVAFSMKGGSFVPPLVGAMTKIEATARIALTQETRQSRRFAAARAAYFAWSSGRTESRLMTNAVTRDQQASRAFAAELLTPVAYIRSQRKNGVLSWDRIQEIAELADVTPDIVRKQAMNNGLMLN